MMQAAHSRPLLDEKHARMQSEYIRVRETEGYTLHGTEVPYSYGKGFVDVVMFRQTGEGKPDSWLVSELKPALHDLGEAIRQVTRAKMLFFGSNAKLLDTRRTHDLHFPLAIWANENNWRQCANYARLLTGIELEFFHVDRQIATAVWNKYEIQKAIIDVRTGTPNTHGDAAFPTLKSPLRDRLHTDD